MNWTEYLRSNLAQQAARSADDSEQRLLRERHFDVITGEAYQAIQEACSANKIQTRFYDDAGHNICVEDYCFRLHLVGTPRAMELTVYLERLGARDMQNLPHIKNAEGSGDILHLAANDICRYVLDQYLSLAGTSRQ